MGFSIACSSSCPFCQFFTITRAGGDSLHCGISTGRRPHMPPVSAGISKAHSRLRLRDLRLGRFAIDDKFEFGRAGTPEPSGRSSLSARRQRFCCFRCLVTCRSGTASGKWTPRSNRSFVRPRPSSVLRLLSGARGCVQRHTSKTSMAPIGVPRAGTWRVDPSSTTPRTGAIAPKRRALARIK